MSPVEFRRIIFGIPIERWKPAPPGTELYDHNPESSGNLTRKTLLGYPRVPIRASVEDNNTIALEVEELIINGGEIDGIQENVYKPATHRVEREDINELGSLGSDHPPIRQEVRWIPEE